MAQVQANEDNVRKLMKGSDHSLRFQLSNNQQAFMKRSEGFWYSYSYSGIVPDHFLCVVGSEQPNGASCVLTTVKNHHEKASSINSLSFTFNKDGQEVDSQVVLPKDRWNSEYPAGEKGTFDFGFLPNWDSVDINVHYKNSDHRSNTIILDRLESNCDNGKSV